MSVEALWIMMLNDVSRSDITNKRQRIKWIFREDNWCNSDWKYNAERTRSETRMNVVVYIYREGQVIKKIEDGKEHYK